MLQEKNPGSSWQAILHLPWPLLPCLRHKTKWRRPLLKPPHHTLMLRRNIHCLKLPTISILFNVLVFAKAIFIYLRCCISYVYCNFSCFVTRQICVEAVVVECYCCCVIVGIKGCHIPWALIQTHFKWLMNGSLHFKSWMLMRTVFLEYHNYWNHILDL